jgi:Na+-translocating ferredoxin:NAD+ oxidoreductase RnfG subunit
MGEKMKIYLQLGLILLAFCLVATALLAYVNTITKPQRSEGLCFYR